MIILWSKCNSRVRVDADVLKIFCIVALVVNIVLFCLMFYSAIIITEIAISNTLTVAAYISCASCLVMIVWLPFYKVLNCIGKLSHWYLFIFMMITFISILLSIIPIIMAVSFTDTKYVKKVYLENLKDNILENKDTSTWANFDAEDECCNWDEAFDIINLGDKVLANIDNNIDDTKFLNTMKKCFVLEKDRGNFSISKGSANTNQYHAEQDKKEVTSIPGCKEKILQEVDFVTTGIMSVGFVVPILSIILIVTMMFYLYNALINVDDNVVLVDQEPKLEIAPSVKTLTAAEELQAETAMLKEGRRQSLRVPLPPRNVQF